jgi:integrase
MAAYKAALAGDGGGKAEKSLEWLIAQYFSSPEVKAMEESTKRLKRRSLDEVCETLIATGKRVGSLPFKGMRREHVVALRDKKADTPEAANKRVKNLSAPFAWAIQAGHASSNPAWKVGKLQSANPGGFYTWTESDVDAFEAQWPIGTRQRLAMSLMLYLGVRVSDAIRLGPKSESQDGAAITFDVWKGRKRSAKVLTLPILPPLRSVLKASI